MATCSCHRTSASTDWIGTATRLVCLLAQGRALRPRYRFRGVRPRSFRLFRGRIIRPFFLPPGMAGMPKMQEHFSAIARDGGNAENAGAFFGLPAQSNRLASAKQDGSHPLHTAKSKRPPQGWPFLIWWRRGESNPRPKVLRPRIYMHSSPFSLVLRQHDVRSAPQDQPVRS